MDRWLIVVLAATALALFVAWRRWNKRQAARIVLRLPAGMLFQLARADGPLNDAERDFILAHAAGLHRLLLHAGNTGIDAVFVQQVLAEAERGLRDSEHNDFLGFLARSPRHAWDFFQLCCKLATVDGPMTWKERNWIDAVATVAMLDASTFLAVTEKLCPCPGDNEETR